MIHLAHNIECYISEYRFYLESLDRHIDDDCKYYAERIKRFAKEFAEDPSAILENWNRGNMWVLEDIESDAPLIMTILEYVDKRVIDALAEVGEMLFRIADDPEDSDEIYTPEERREEKLAHEEFLAKLEKDHDLHIACMLEARAYEIVQDCSGFLKKALLKFGVTTSEKVSPSSNKLGITKVNADTITEKAIDELIEELDQKLKNMTYEDILALYPKQKTPEKVEKEEKIVVPEEEPYDGPELPF